MEINKNIKHIYFQQISNSRQLAFSATMDLNIENGELKSVDMFKSCSHIRILLRNVVSTRFCEITD